MLFRSVLLSGLAIIILSPSAVFGQEKTDGADAAGPPAPPPPPAPPAPPAAPAPASPDTAASPDATLDAAQLAELEALAAEQEVEVITVTGSSIERKELTSAAPVATLDKQELEASGMVSIGDILQNLPAQGNAVNAQVNNGGDGSTRISLRGLGAERTLVLVNGRRHVPGGTGANASVDLNAIPLAIIERVEVLKDGASAIYGSDALGGVVNIITRKNFEGVEASVYTGTTQNGGGTVYDVSAVTGTRNKKGGIIFAAGFAEQRPIRNSQREFSKSDKRYDWECTREAERAGDCQKVATNGSTSIPGGYINVRGERQPNVEVGSQAWQELRGRDPEKGGAYYNDPVEGWRQFRATGNSDVGEGDFFNYQPYNYLVTPQRRYNLFSSGDYRFHDRINSFFEASYTNRTSDQRLAPSPLNTRDEEISVSGMSVYNPFGRDFSDVRKRVVEAGTRNFLQDIDTFRAVAGLEGDLPPSISDTWRWNVSFQYGKTTGTEINQGQFVRSRVREAIGPSFIDGNGTARCGTVDNPGDASCVPLNLLGGEGSITQEMLDYVGYTGIGQGFTEQTSVVATSNGRLFKTPWNGDMRLGLGAEYRDEAGGFQPDPITASGDTTGNKSEPTQGGYDVKSAFAELSFVPVSEIDIAKWLELSAAVRVFDYSTFGTDYTWKTGGLWRLYGGLTMRGTYSTAFRAPNIGELFSGQADSFPNVTDPCDTSMGARSATIDMNCRNDGVADNYVDNRSQIRSQTGGNPKLKPETARVLTLGMVYEPPPLPGMAVTIDYFKVKVKNAIQPTGASVILSNCYAQENRADCDRIARDAGGFITNITDLESNIGGTETSGVDFALSYQYKAGFLGQLQHSAEATLLHQYDEIQPSRRVSGLDVYDLGVFPSWKANFGTVWGKGPVGAGTNVRFVQAFRECQDNDCSGENPSRRVKANVTADVYASYRLNTPAGNSSLTAGVNNVLDQAPSKIFSGFLATSDASTYDFMGRFFYLRLVQQF